MGRLFLDPGLFDRHAVLEAAVDLSDGMGGATRSWTALRPLFLHLVPEEASARERFDRNETQIRHRVLCRKRADVVAGNRFRLGARLLAIETAHDPDERGRYLVCRCLEEI